MLTVGKGFVNGYRDSPNIVGLVDNSIDEYIDGYIEKFGESVGKGATKNPVSLNLDFEKILIPVISGIVLFFILKNL